MRVSALDVEVGNQERVGLTYKALTDDVKRGDTLLLDDGAVVLWVEEVTGAEIETRVVVGGTLSNNKGINLQGGGLSAQSLTEKDRADIRVAADMQADYVAVSFPRRADDINEARELLYRAGGHGGIVAKIERAEAMQALNEIIEASDAVMIARGDLGVEIGDVERHDLATRPLLCDHFERFHGTGFVGAVINDRIVAAPCQFDADGPADAFAAGAGANHVAAIAHMRSQTRLVGFDVISPHDFFIKDGYVSGPRFFHPDMKGLRLRCVRRKRIGITRAQYLMNNGPDLVKSVIAR